jgi:spermidine synthase
MNLSRRNLYAITFITAMCTLIYELLIAQSISFFSSNSVVWYSLTIGLYLVSMGAGAFKAEKLADSKHLIPALIKLEIILSLIGGMVVLFIYFSQMMMTFLWVRGLAFVGVSCFYLVALVCILAVGFLTGLELPLLIQIGEKDSNKPILNRILSADYFGSLAGGLAFPILLFPHFELINIGWMIAIINLLIAVVLLVMTEKYHRSFWKWILPVSAIFIAFLSCSKPINQYFLDKFYYYEDSVNNVSSLVRPVNNHLKAQREQSAYQKIDLVQLPLQEPLNSLVPAFSKKFSNQPNFPRSWTLFMDGYFQLWADFEELYHEYFVHMPIQLNGHVPENVLVLGAGDGCLLRELIKYPEIKKITLVEIDPHIVQLARKNDVLKRINQNSFSDPRVNVVITDAFHYVRNSNEQFDAVFLDFPAPKDYNLSKIFSREFYSFIYKRLNSDGFAVLDAPRMKFIGEGQKQVSPETLIYQETLFQAGFPQLIRFASYLETDNEEAQNIFLQMVGDNNQLIVHEKDINGEQVSTIVGKEAIAEKMTEDFVNDYREEFLMVRKTEKKIEKDYLERGLTLNVFNQKRFNLSVDHLTIETSHSEHPELVNSIMRPTLPRMDELWQVKMPY